MTPNDPSRTRMSADERREQLVSVAMREFAGKGFYGASTETIARAAGISHGYVFRLFPTKQALMLACAERCRTRIIETFRDAAARFARGEAEADHVLEAMGGAYKEMLRDRELLRMQLQLWVSATVDDDLRATAQRHYGEVIEEIERLSGADPETVSAFVGHGMLMNVASVLSLDEVADQPWVTRLLPHLSTDPEGSPS